jgi:adenylate cyclase class IV
MQTYRTTDLYIAAYLKALGFDCEIQTDVRKSTFLFPEAAKEVATIYVTKSDRNYHNVNASVLVDEIKKLKTFVNTLYNND